MNIKNIEAAIRLMIDAKKHNSLNMQSWQRTGSGITAYNIDDLHACGNTARLAGYISLSEEFKAAGGCYDYALGPVIPVTNDSGVTEKLVAETAIAHWFGVSVRVATHLIFRTSLTTHSIYGVEWNDVKPDHVILALTKLINLGEDKFTKKYLHNQ